MRQRARRHGIGRPFKLTEMMLIRTEPDRKTPCAEALI
jgi:hypothetical protein